MSSGWQKSFFGCFGEYHGGCSSFGLCLKASCCPCVVLGRTMHRVEHDGDMQDYKTCNADCIAVCALHTLGGGAGWHYLGWVYNTFRRGKMREHYGIEGNFCLDCLYSCCGCCALIQQERESYAREQQNKVGGPIRNVIFEQPRAQMPMKPPKAY